jgi:hypothetical protein
MTRQPQSSSRPHAEEAHAAMARVFGADLEPRDAAAWQSTAPEPPADEAERRAALGRVFGTEA